MKEVYPGIFLIQEKGAFGSVKPTENIYILAGYDGLIFDAGYGKKKVVKYFIKEFKEIEESYKKQNKEFRINRLLPSHAHPDHISGLKLLRKYLKVKIILTKKTAKIIKNKKNFKRSFEPNMSEDYLTVKRRFKDRFQKILMRLIYYRLYGLTFLRDPDEIIEEDSEISINGELWRIFPSPGHASDHISLYNEEKGILFSGDNIIRNITTWLGPPDSNLEDYIKSIETIQKLPNLKFIFSAHGRHIKNLKKRISEILEHRKERTSQVLDLINENSKTGISPIGIIKALYPNANKMMQQVARGWICLTLKMLEDNNFVKRVIGKKKIFFFPFEKD